MKEIHALPLQPAPAQLAQRRLPPHGARWLQATLASGLASLALTSVAQDRPALKVAVSRALAPPFVMWRDNQAVAGIDVDIGRALAAQLKAPVEFTPLPRLRVEAALHAGEADIACNLSPLQAPRGDALPQSPVLFELQDMLAGHPSAVGVDSLEQLPAGSVLGTLQGQAYPLFEPLFAQGRLKRDDALDDERMLRKLSKDRHPYGISNRQTFTWFTQQDGEDKLASWRLPLGQRPYRCSYSTRGGFDARQMNAAIEQLISTGQIEKITAAHSVAPLAVVVSVRSGLRNVSRSALAELFMGQRSTLGENGTTEPVISSGPERQLFFASILQRDPAQFRAAWAAQQFGGRRRAPLELSNAEAMKAHLQRHAQAIGFLPLAQVDSSLRIIYLP